MYLLKLALRPWKISAMSQLFSSLAVGLLLVLASFLMWFGRGLEPVLDRLQNRQVITAYLESAVEEKDETRVMDSIKVTLGDHPVEVRAVAPGEFVKSLDENYPELTKEIESMGQEMNQIVPRYISITGYVPEGTVDQIKAINGVESVDSSRDRYMPIVGTFKALQWVAKVLTLGLTIALLTGLAQLSRLNAGVHREALGMMRQWGATPLQLRMPGLLSGMSVGAVGGAIAGLSWIVASQWFAVQIITFSPLLKGISAPSAGVGVLLIFVGAAFGTISAVINISELRS